MPARTKVDSMKTNVSLLLFVLIGIGLASDKTAAGPDSAKTTTTATTRMPEVLWNPKWEYPFWVSKEMAFGPHGELEKKLFHPDRWQTLKDLLAGPQIDGCVRLEEVYLEYVDRQPRNSVNAALESAELVIHGKVTGRADGFDIGLPATLIRLEVLDLVKGSSELREVFFAWPIATFSVAGKRICKTDYRYADLPEEGDEVIAFVRQTVPETFAMLQIESPGDVIVLKPERIVYPSTMTRDAEASAANLTTRTQLLQKLGIAEKRQ